MSDFVQSPHRRYNPLLREWVLVSPHRTQRPWQGRTEVANAQERIHYDPGCYLCPGNARAGGHVNPGYEGTFVFSNDFPALLPESVDCPNPSPLLRSEAVRGECRVLCFSPRHDLTLANLELGAVEKVVRAWQTQEAELFGKWRWVQIFENKGEVMGCSNPHPHGQVWASDSLPSLIGREAEAQAQHLEQHGTVLLEDVRAFEEKDGARVVERSDSWTVVVPFWAVWPFETLVMARRPVGRLSELTPLEAKDLAAILKRLLMRYDRLFETDFPYSMGWHPAPTGASGWQLHAHIYPPLLRSASVRKFMVGYEMLAEPQRDITPEQAAEMLRTAQ
ncbi:MAG: UDP-glucose--hexose-1-phosphate uridylyltransferase [Armatimonadetes bacterium]|nr:UDP-glucose--hexose-1-phosphate uridylyltransferase [Armatimonadota bacterium]